MSDGIIPLGNKCFATINEETHKSVYTVLQNFIYN
jgi:hypothetical protein